MSRHVNNNHMNHAGKGPQLRKGANLTKYYAGFPEINWHRKVQRGFKVPGSSVCVVTVNKKQYTTNEHALETLGAEMTGTWGSPTVRNQTELLDMLTRLPILTSSTLKG